MPGIIPTISRSLLESSDERHFVLASWILTTADPIGVPISIPDYIDKVWTIGNASGDSFGGTGVCSLKGAQTQPQNSTAAGAKTHTLGTAAGATTDAAGYAIGATVITLAAAGTGTINVNDVITFGTDVNTAYRVTVGNADVSLGGTVTITPALTVALSAAAKAITVRTSYPVGTSTIYLTAVGTGTLLVGDRITFAGDATSYRITSGDIDVSNGGSLSIHPPLQVALSNGNIAITLVADSAGVVLNKASTGLTATASAAGVITTIENCSWVYPQLTTVGVAATVTVRLLARRPSLLRR